ncbi:MAG: hypothetical protein M5R36_13040 [Deltaproteobacteria bacterium]|nr:hypothetical protein [Deltaproteobacteria bacterium]
MPPIVSYIGVFISAPIFLVSAVIYFIILVLAMLAAALGLAVGSPAGKAVIALFLVGGVLAAYGLTLLSRRFRQILPLGKLGTGAWWRERYGAKAVNLGRLVRAGRPVPRGYAIRGFPAGTRPDVAEVRRCARLIRRRFGETPIIIRSSFSQEDAQGAVYSGVFRSVASVNAADETAVIDAVHAVLDSAGETRAKRTNSAPGAPSARGRLAMIAQEMSDDAFAGFASTHDRARRRPDLSVIEIAAGAEATIFAINIPGRRASRSGRRTVRLLGSSTGWPPNSMPWRRLSAARWTLNGARAAARSLFIRRGPSRIRKRSTYSCGRRTWRRTRC